MTWYLIAAVVFLIALGLLVFNFLRERRYLKKRVSEAMRSEVRQEIEEERALLLARRERFRSILKKVDENKLPMNE